VDDDALADIEDIYALSPLQLGMLFQTRLAPRSGVFVQQVAAPLVGIDPAAFVQSWQPVVDRTPALRTSFHWAELEHPVQVVHRDVPLTVEHVDWSRMPTPRFLDRLRAHLASARQRGFDLDVAPLLRVELLHLPYGQLWFAWHFHHILLDGWSSQLLLAELVGEYGARVRHQRFEPVPREPFSTYIGWLQQQDEAAAEQYWRSVLRGFTTPTALGVAPEPGRNEDEPGTPVSGTEVVVEVPAGTTAALLRFARTNRLTLGTVMQGAWALLLSRYSGEHDVVFGTIVSGRRPELAGVEQMIGLFINSLPLRVDVDPGRELVGWLRQLQSGLLDTMRYDYASPMQISQWSDLPPGTRPYDTVVIFENLPSTGTGRDPGASPPSLDFGWTDLPLSLMVAPGDVLRITFRSDGRTVGAAAVERIAEHLTTLLTVLPEAAGRPLRSISLLPEVERRRIVTEWNATATTGWADTSVVALLAEQVGRSPGATAFVEARGTCITFAELHDRVSRLAGHLAARGVRIGDVVGVHLPRSIDAAVALLAILQAGGAYLPLDQAYPAERLAAMVAESQAVLVVTRGWPSGAGEVPCVAPGAAAEPIDPPIARTTGPLREPTADDLAYVLFTSGSTGVPKGVAVEHRTVLNRLWWMWRRFPFAAGELGVVRTSLNFVDSLWELLGPLLRGVPSLIVDDEVVGDPRAFTELAAAHGVSRLFLVPSYLDVLLDACPDLGRRLPALRLWFTGGEPLTLGLWQRFRRAAPDAELHNIYGSTELWDVTHADVGLSVASDADRGPAEARVTIGWPIDNTRAYVVDPDGEPVPLGVTGRLCFAGTALARGYLDDALTRQRFSERSFDGRRVERLFDTGDLARLGADGSVEVVGRRDQQIKLRGHRVEPGEIEAVLERHPHVGEAAVALWKPAPGDERLVAYVVRSGDECDETDMRAAMVRALPAHMVPQRIVRLDRMPRTPSGKKDRRSLPQPTPAAAGGSGDRRDRSARSDDELEQLLATAFATLLGVDQVGPEDHFFGDLGGHSLLAVRLCSRLTVELGVEVPVRAVFDHPTTRLLAAHLRPLVDAAGHGDGTAAVTALDPGRANGDDPRPEVISARAGDGADQADYPLSFAQERLWFLDQLAPGSAAYNMSFAHRLGFAADERALERALSELVSRHEALRTTFPTRDGEPVQRVGPARPVACPVHDLGHLPARRSVAETKRIAARLAGEPFDLAEGPLLRCALVRSGLLGDVFVLVLHHIVIDGWSFEIIFRELAALYRDEVTGEPWSLPPVPMQYVDYTVWQRRQLAGPVLDRLVDYWRTALDGAATLGLPTDRPRPPLATSHGAQIFFDLDPATVAALRRVAQHADASLFMVLLAGFVALLHRYTGQDDVVVGTPVASRNRLEFEGTVGFFANTLVLRCDLSGDPDFLELVGRARVMTLDAYDHQDLPFSTLVSALKPRQDLSRNPLFQVSFQLLSSHEGGATPHGPGGDATATALAFERGTAIFDLALNMVDAGAAVQGQFEFNTDLFDAGRIEALRDHFVALLADAGARPETRVGDLAVLSEAERQQLDTWGRGPAEPSAPATVHGLFEEQVRRTPEARAVCDHGSVTLTYAELDRRADRLAAAIVERVGRGGRIAVVVRPSVDLVVAVLAVLKSGNAYVPVDREVPAARLRTILADAEVRLALVDAATRGAFGRGADSEAGALDVDALDVVGTDVDAPPPGTRLAAVGPDDGAYVIFTSGSTGRPKGVGVRHRSVVNYLRWCAATYPVDEGAGAPLVSSIGADMAVTSLFVPLISGKAVFLLDDADVVEALDTALRGPETFSFVKLTPSHLHALRNLAVGRDPPLGTRAFVVGGEALRGETLAPWREAAPDLLAWNEYGPTEATVACCAHGVRLGDVGDGAVPIGRPIAGTELSVLDAAGRPVPVGVVGELHVAGAGLAEGYVGDPALTGERFGQAGQRRYRTGDRVRWSADGTLEYVGRVDRQLKVRGHRIEPGEIESVLARHPAVAAAAVVARDLGHDDRRLVAHVVAAPVGDGEGPADGLVGELAALARRELPAPLVPHRIVVVDALPITASGKLDLDALAAEAATTLPSRGARPQPEDDPPRTGLEKVVALVFSNVLVLDAVGAHEDFFADVGGDSLLATKVVARLRQYLDADVPLRLLFEEPTVAGLAGALVAAAEPGAEVERRAELLLEVLELSEDAVEERLVAYATKEDR
jgi:amino acid adenylation domain-containing protein